MPNLKLIVVQNVSIIVGIIAINVRRFVLALKKVLNVTIANIRRI